MRNLLLLAGICVTLSPAAYVQAASNSKAAKVKVTKKAVKPASSTIRLSKGSPVTIVLPTTAIPAEETGAEELQHYLRRIVGANCQIVREEGTARTGPTIYVGATNFASRHAGKPESFADEEWAMQTQGRSVILTGGRPRGGLYAVYHFLEDVCGVRWWNPKEETVPTRNTLAIPTLKQRGKPAFRYRDIYALYAYDKGRFAAHSRLNRQGFEPVSVVYGGARTYGPPAQSHTFFQYMPPEKYYKEHPDWYTIRGEGPPNISNSQLNVGNKGMRAEFLRLLRENIRTARRSAIAKGEAPPDVFDVSQNDGGVSWVGPEDADLVKREGTTAASMVDFINYLADGIKDEFPTVSISTLAYHSGETAPKTIHPRDNAIITLTDTRSNVLLPVTAPRNRIFRENVEAWGKISKQLRIWDYNVTYRHPNFPTPTVQTYAPDLRFLLKNNAEGMFIELEFPIEADMRDLKVWVLCKLLEDPSQDPDVLIRRFTDGFYGPAGPFVRRYLAALEATVNQTEKTRGMPNITWFAGSPLFTYLTPDFLRQANTIFDEAAATVARNPILSRRLRHARFSVDEAILSRYSQLTEALVRSGQPASALALDRDAIGKRFARTWQEQIDLRSPSDGRAADLKRAAMQVEALTTGPQYTPIPEKFKDVPLSDIYTFGVGDTRYEGPSPLGVYDNGLAVNDLEAPSGQVRRMFISDEQAEKYRLPTAWGVYANAEAKTLLTEQIKPEDIPGPGYHWYRLGVVAPTPSSYVFLTWSWHLQTDIGSAVNALKPYEKFEIWANLKFAGPIFPHGKATEKNSVSVDRVVLIRQK